MSARPVGPLVLASVDAEGLVYHDAEGQLFRAPHPFQKPGAPHVLYGEIGADTGPPVRAPEVRRAFTDEYGDVWVDAEGYLYRHKGPFDARYRAHLEMARGGVPEWTDAGTHYRSWASVPAWRNSFALFSRWVAEGAAPVIPGMGATIAIVAILGIGLAAYLGPGVLRAISGKG